MSRVIKSPGDIRLEISCPQRSCPGRAYSREGIRQNRNAKMLATRRLVNWTPPCLRCHGKNKQGSMWFPCRLVIDTRRTKAVCVLAAWGSNFPCGLVVDAAEGGKTTRQRVGFTQSRWVLDSSLVPIVLLAKPPPLFPALFAFLTTGC